jgi:phosphatidylserine/phosphatidylglycerophosphate/cardiolipin synthase-like enzyme
MLGGSGKENHHYYGTDTYKYINGMIKSSRRMYIVSPYIDRYYANLMARSTRSTEFYIISSSIDVDAKKRLEKGGSKIILALWAIASILLFYLEFAAGVHSYLLAFSILPILWGFGRYSSGSRAARRIHIKVPRQFVHAKTYVSDQQAISGSVNLTYKGTHSNVEHIEVSKDPREVGIMQEQFWELWNRY